MEKVHVLIDSRFIRNYRNMEPVLGKAVKSDKNPLFRDEAIETGEKDCGILGSATAAIPMYSGILPRSCTGAIIPCCWRQGNGIIRIMRKAIN